MSPKKQYQKRLPTVLPPAPRRAPDLESTPNYSRPDDAAPDEAAPAEPSPVEAAPVVPENPPEHTGATATPDPEPSATERRPGRLLGVALLAVAVCGAGLAVGVGLPRLFRDPPAATTAPAAEPDPAPAGAVQENYVEARVRRDGTVAVREWIRSEDPIREVLVVPPDVGPDAVLSAEGVRVTADEAPVGGPRTIDGTGATYRFPAATVVRLSYRLTGAAQVSDPTIGRALVVATSLDVRYTPAPANETRVVHAPSVLSLACAPPGTGTLEPCGVREGAQWRVDLAGERTNDRVVAVVDLGG